MLALKHWKSQEVAFYSPANQLSSFLFLFFFSFFLFMQHAMFTYSYDYHSYLSTFNCTHFQLVKELLNINIFLNKCLSSNILQFAALLSKTPD